MNDLSKRIAALSPEQQALLKRRLQQPKQSPQLLIPKRSASISVADRDRSTHLPVSFAQQRMWFQDQLGTNSAVSNNISISLHITGTLQITALEQSLREILQRHESLRTTLQMVEGELTQFISPVDPWKLPTVDLRSLPATEREQEAQRLAIAQACQPFNLETDLLLQTILLQLDATEFTLLLTMHHVAVDAWSIGIFFRELSAVYGAFSSGMPSPLAALPIQYADFAVWQRQSLQGSALSSDLAYWKQTLQNAPDLLQLPSDCSRPAVQSFNGKTLSFTVPKSLTELLKQLSQKNEATLFMTLLAALQTLLFRYSGQDDILVGSPIANRQQPEVENLIGCFINTLVLRTDLSGNPSFRALLQRVRETVLAALAHQTLPFETLVEELQLARSLTYAPLFQVMLVLQNAFSIQTIELPDLSVEHERIDNHTAQFDLTFHLVESDNGLIGKLEYSTDLFDETTIVRLVDHFHTLLASIVENPDQLLSQLPLLTLAEQQQILAWSQTEVSFPQIDSIHELIEAQVQRTPDAIAVVQGNERLSYQELNQRANQLAHYLQKLGIKPECLVGIYVDRSISMLVGLLGILKAGSAYIPLDPAYPSQRLQSILSDAQVSLLLTQKSLETTLPNINSSIIFLDADWEKIALEGQENPRVPVSSQNLAYVIYTSGSTGTPKGVMVQHQSLVNYTEAAIAHYEISACDRVLQFASISFDAAAEEIFPCLAQGATLLLRTDEMLSSIAGFLNTCYKWQLTVLDLPTAFWHQMVTEMAAHNLTLPDCVRLVIIGGEKALLDRFILWQQRVNSTVRLVNSYGPTEATIVTTTIDLSAFTAEEFVGRELPIGKPVRNARTYILDPSLQPTPIGIPGELYIGGIGVARGYLNRPDLTAQAFIPDPFSHVSGARLYRTGDRARYRADGTIEFLGRIDHQVKLRGFRIELGEIEASLTQHSAVQDAVVIDREDATGDKQLIAYVVPAAGYAPTPRQLRQFLEKRLPRYMLPAAFLLLDALPLSATGKVDRQRLPVPDLNQRETETFIAPRTSIETTIAQMYAEMLNLTQVSVEDDFFELGGHSLLATKLMTRLVSAFPVALTIVDLFQSPTVAGLAARIETLQRLTAPLNDENPPARLKLLDSTRTPETPVPLSFSQQYMWETHHSSSLGAALNSSIILRVNGQLIPSVVEQSLNEIVRRHEILRTVFQTIEGQPVQIALPMLHLPLISEDLQQLAPELRESAAFDLAITLAQCPFDLATAPLLRAALLQLAPQEYWLLITMHHIITDGWSFGILLQELHTLIDAFSSGFPSPLPEVEIQYADFARWQRQVYDETAIAQQLAYWRQTLVDEAPAPESESLSHCSQLGRQANHVFGQLPEPLVKSIASLSRSLGVTDFAVLLAALKLALAAWSGQREIIIVTTVGNRTVPETERMIGCFINDVIVRSQLLPEQTGASLIQQLQTNVQAAIRHKEVPINRVIEQTKRFRPFNIMASVTIIPSTQDVESTSGWEVVEVQRHQQWDDVPSELFADYTPLEIYIELSKPIRIMVNYSVDQFAA